LDLPLGSPIIPVAPPVRKMGRMPRRLSLFIMMIDTKLPFFSDLYLSEANLRWDRSRNIHSCLNTFA